MSETWWLYMIECTGGGIYTGIAKDVQSRYEKHLSGKGAKYTKMNPPVRLLYKAEFPNHQEAAQEEWRIKQLNREEKITMLVAMGAFPV